MPYRELTDAEIKRILVQRQNFESWQRYTQHMTTYYGPEAARAEVTFVSRYNDEYYVPDIGIVEVYDRAGIRLPPLLDVDLLKRGGIGEYDLRPLREGTADEEDIEQIGYSLWDDDVLELPDGLDLDTNEEDGQTLIFDIDRPQDWQPRAIYVYEEEQPDVSEAMLAEEAADEERQRESDEGRAAYRESLERDD